VPVLLWVCVKKASVSFPSSSERHPWSLLPPSWFWFTAHIFASVISLPLSKSALFLLALFLLLSPADWSSFPPDHRRGRELSHGFCLAPPGLSFPWLASAGAPQFVCQVVGSFASSFDYYLLSQGHAIWEIVQEAYVIPTTLDNATQGEL
jgi:hypothetical protein